MTREEAIEQLQDAKDGYKEYLSNEALEMAIKALEQESTTKNNLVLIHTEGLDEEIRCTMCTNSMKSDRGCDGSCVVNKDMYKAVTDAIEKRIQPITKNDLGVEKIVDVLGSYTDLDIPYKHKIAEDILNNLSSVTPQEPKTGHWILTEDDFVYCSECEDSYYPRPIDASWYYCPHCGCRMVEPRESEGKE